MPSSALDFQHFICVLISIKLVRVVAIFALLRKRQARAEQSTCRALSCPEVTQSAALEGYSVDVVLIFIARGPPQPV
jgi:hypothetical protein